MPAQKTFRSIRVRGLARFEGGVVGLSTGGNSSKEYAALLSQFGTDAPAATSIIGNTLGGEPVWSRLFEGSYLLTLAGAFPLDKVYAPIITLVSASGLTQLTTTRQDDDTLAVVVSGTGEALFDLQASNIPFYVRVYE